MVENTKVMQAVETPTSDNNKNHDLLIVLLLFALLAGLSIIIPILFVLLMPLGSMYYITYLY